MKAKNIITVVLATLMAITIAGVASAGETLADHNQFEFNAPLTKVDITGKDFVYDQNYWQQAEALTEDSDDQYNFDAPETKAEIAAKSHRYNKEALERVGTEEGSWEYRQVRAGNKAFAAESSQEAHCSKC